LTSGNWKGKGDKGTGKKEEGREKREDFKRPASLSLSLSFR
jgi:hypothetical protein